uniref:SecY-independent transporter protein n=1 Tax=Madagascaria erythrocladioides TaxID=753684 RepID=UPI001FCD8CD2|nr:SecY-independent transporter protein [Madagascaria erythrocladioides]UNJ18788.1 SecY-independent transporter protein [Madagascaria erythrocladioides]
MKPYIKHSYEFFYRLFYIIISFFMCFFICYVNSNTVITFISYPYLKINLFKRLIALNLSEVFYTSIVTCYFFTLFIWFPFVVYQTGAFFMSAWFKSQIYDFFIVNFYLWVLNLSGLVFCYYLVTPVLCFFFLQWEITKDQALLLLEIEPRITYYIKWVLPLSFLLGNTFSFFFFFFFYTIIFFVLSFFPLDLSSLIVLSFFFFLFYEIFLFFCCLF